MACVFATTKTHHNENSTRRSSGQPTRYFIALRIVLFHMLNWFALCCGPLGHQDPIFISYIPDLKLKNWHVWFLANHREKKVPTSSISLENTMPKIGLWQQQHCSFHYFFPSREVLSSSRILHYLDSSMLQRSPWLYLYCCQVIHRCWPTEGTPAWGVVCTPTAQSSHPRGKHSAHCAHWWGAF